MIQISRKKYLAISILVIAVITLSFFGGYFVHSEITSRYNRPKYITNEASNEDINVSLADFWETWSLLQGRFPFEAPDSDKKINGAIAGLVSAYEDPYTKFFPPQEAKLFKEEINGSFAGVGIEIDVRDGMLTVVSPLYGTPGYEAGILAGDIIYKIDDQETLDMSIDTAVQNIRGEVGTAVVLTMIREGESEPVPISVVRDNIHVPIIKTSETDEGIDVIKLLSFTHGSAREFSDAVMGVIKDGAQGIVIDLRNNPGGVLDEAVDIADMFLDKGMVVVGESQGDEVTYQYKTSREKIVSDQVKLVVLVNGGSASASEILAGALQDYDRAVIVGETTFGKGSVQELISVGKKGSALKVTVAHWLTPDGRTINNTGLEPDFMVTMSADDIKDQNDVQLKEAVRILLESIES